MNDFLMWAGSLIVGGVLSLIGWVFKMIFSALKEHRTDHESVVKSIADHKLHAAENFATRKEVSDGFKQILSAIKGIDDKLDSKVDKK